MGFTGLERLKTMLLKRVIRPTNNRIRLVVGILLAAMFCIQCSQPEVLRSSNLEVTAIAGGPGVSISQDRLKELERLAGTDHVTLLKQALANYGKSYQDYTCTFTKRERINGKFRDEQEIKVKFLDSPFSVVMEWVRNPGGADKIMYIDGKHNGQMLIIPHGWLAKKVTGGLTTRDPEGKDVMADTLRPVTLFGFKRMLESLLEVNELAVSRGEGKFTFEGYKTKAKKIMVLKRILPPKKDYPAKTTTWYLDVDHLVPVGMEAKDWDDRETCRYFYSNVKFNIGLTENDFTPKANGMKVK